MEKFKGSGGNIRDGCENREKPVPRKRGKVRKTDSTEREVLHKRGDVRGVFREENEDMSVADVIKEFVVTILALVEIVGFVLIIGFAGGVDMGDCTLTEGFQRILITMGAMAVAGVLIFLMCRENKKL